MPRTIEPHSTASESTLGGLRLLVSLPALDEDRTIREIIEGIPRDLPGIGDVDVLVVDDGSTDRTAELARAAGAEVVAHRSSQGVGAAFHTALNYGIEHGADVIVTIDADGQFDPADIPALVAPVVAGHADFVTASRFKDPSLVPRMPWVKRAGNDIMSRLISRLTGQKFHDVSCGFRCYNRRAVLNLHLLGRFTYTQEVFLNLAFKGFDVLEVPTSVRGVRQHGRSRVASSLWRYGFKTARIIFRSYRDYHPLRFFGGLALMLIVPAIGLGGFLGYHYVRSGALSPHKWAGIASITLIGLSLILLHMGMIGDMLNRHRIYLEEILYRQRSEAGRNRRD